MSCKACKKNLPESSSKHTCKSESNKESGSKKKSKACTKKYVNSTTSNWFCTSGCKSKESCNCSSQSENRVCDTSDLYTCPPNLGNCSQTSLDSCSESSESCGCSSEDNDPCSLFTTKAFRKPRKAVEGPICKIEKYTGPEIYAHYRGAVVNVLGKASLQSTLPPEPTIVTTSYSGNGFLITKKHFVVCPAHLVILPSGVAQSRIPPPPAGQITPVNEIYVTVFGVNQSGVKSGRDTKSYVYTATLIGVDGAGDIALLKLNKASGPKLLDCHPYFKFGCSVKYSIGNTVYSIGNGFGNDFRALSSGIVSNNKAFNQEGLIDYEEFLTTLRYNTNIEYRGPLGTQEGVSFPLFIDGNDGAPVIDVTGRVVGMITTSYAVATDLSLFSRNFTDNNALAVSARFMKCVLKSFIKSYCSGVELPNTKLLTDSIGDPANTFYSFRKGFIGASWNVVDAPFYSGVGSFTGATGATGAQCRQVIGIITGSPLIPVAGVTGFTGANYDIITHIDCIEVGNLPDQLALTAYTWRKIPGDVVKLTLRTAASQYNTDTEVKVTLVDFPWEYDYSPQFFITPGLLLGSVAL